MSTDTVPLDHPLRCQCGGKGCGCPCHTPTRDNTNTDDDLELDRLKARVAELEANQSVLRDHIDTLNAVHDAVSTRANEAVRLLDAERTERQRAEIERDAARAGLTAQDLDLSRQIHAMRDERDEWRDKARALSAQVLDVLKRLGVTP